MNIHLRNSIWPLKNDGWKTTFLLRWYIFRGHVKLPVCIASFKALFNMFTRHIIDHQIAQVSIRAQKDVSSSIGRRSGGTTICAFCKCHENLSLRNKALLADTYTPEE